ncbi:MAG: PadR family transcriptional regulator [Egibacteraceae bacterium]
MVRSEGVRPTPQTAAVLRVFLACPGDEHYGFELSKTADLPTGTVYPILSRLEDAGWLVSSWEQIDPSVEGRRPRRNYRITEKGAVAARSLIQTVDGRLARWGVPKLGQAQA